MRRTRRSHHAAQRVPPPGHLGPTAGRYFIGENYIEVPVESWIYNLGPNKLMRKVIFEAGVVVEIETLGYGYNQ